MFTGIKDDYLAPNHPMYMSFLFTLFTVPCLPLHPIHMTPTLIPNSLAITELNLTHMLTQVLLDQMRLLLWTQVKLFQCIHLLKDYSI